MAKTFGLVEVRAGKMDRNSIFYEILTVRFFVLGEIKGAGEKLGPAKQGATGQRQNFGQDLIMTL